MTRQTSEQVVKRRKRRLDSGNSSAGTSTTKRRRSRADSVYNAFSQLGTRSDRHTHTEVREKKRLQRHQLDNLYEGFRFCRTIVDRPPHDATRTGIEVKLGDQDEAHEGTQEALKELEVDDARRHAHKLARYTGGAAIVFVLDDGRRLDQPVVDSAVREVKALHVVDRFELQPVEWCGDLESPHFGEPEAYLLTPHQPHRTADLGTQRVHADRVARFEGLPVRRERKAHYDGWGQPVLESAYQALLDIGTASDALGSAVHEFQYDVIKFDNLAALMTGPDGGVDTSRFEKRLEMAMMSKSLLNALVLDSEDSHQQRSANMKGLLEAYSVFQQNLASEVDMPMSLIFGQAPDGFSQNDETGADNYQNSVRSDREEYHRPFVEKTLRYLFHSDQGPTDGRVPQSWDLGFGALEEPSEKERAEIRKNVAEADDINIKRGVYSADEARRRYEQPEFRVDLPLGKDDASEDPSFESMREEVQKLTEQANGGSEPATEALRSDAPRAMRRDPYSDKPPPKVRESIARRHWSTWVDVFNDVYERASDLDEDEREARAFAQAHAAVTELQEDSDLEFRSLYSLMLEASSDEVGRAKALRVAREVTRG